MDKTVSQATKYDILDDGKYDHKRYKDYSLSIAQLMMEVDMRRASAMVNCGNVLGFVPDEDKPSGKRLAYADYCHQRMCPMCQWRRSLKVKAQLRQIVNYLGERKRQRYLFVTLTIRNCQASELRATIDQLMAAWDALRRYPEFNLTRKGTRVRGYYRALEVTHNADKTSDAYNTYHPHIHALFCVAPTYFDRDNAYYCSYDRLREIWQRCLGVNYAPQVGIEAIKQSKSKDIDTMTKAIAEIGKYTVKASDIIVPDDWELSVETLRTLTDVMYGRRCLSYGGNMREAHKALHLDDAEDGDLVNFANEESVQEDSKMIYYVWRYGYTQDGGGNYIGASHE